MGRECGAEGPTQLSHFYFAILGPRPSPDTILVAFLVLLHYFVYFPACLEARLVTRQDQRLAPGFDNLDVRLAIGYHRLYTWVLNT